MFNLIKKNSFLFNLRKNNPFLKCLLILLFQIAKIIIFIGISIAFYQLTRTVGNFEGALQIYENNKRKSLDI